MALSHQRQAEGCAGEGVGRGAGAYARGWREDLGPGLWLGLLRLGTSAPACVWGPCVGLHR